MKLFMEKLLFCYLMKTNPISDNKTMIILNSIFYKLSCIRKCISLIAHKNLMDQPQATKLYLRDH